MWRRPCAPEAEQVTLHSGELPQSILPAQLPGLPAHVMLHSLASAQFTPLGQGLLPLQPALQGTPGGHVIESQPVPQPISHTPATHVPSVQTASHAA